MRERNAPAPTVEFQDKEIVLDHGGAFTLKFSIPGSRSDLRLIIDIYDLDNPVHPEGHVGWWRYDFDSFGRQAVGRVAAGQDGSLDVELGIPAADSWRNPADPRPKRWTLIAVLRSSITNAIVSLQRIPVLRSDSELIGLRAAAQGALEPRGDIISMHYILPARTRIHLVLPNLFPRDAVGKLMFDLRNILAQHRSDVTLVADNFDLALNHIIEYRDGLSSRLMAGDTLVYSFSTHDPKLAELLSFKDVYKIGYFHGVTQPRLLQVFDPELSMTCAKAIKQIPLLAEFDQLATNSQYNLKQLHAIFQKEGCKAPGEIKVIPPALTAGTDAVHALPQRAGADGRSSLLLYVGRIKSHKRIEDILHLLAEYRKLRPAARCMLVGEADNRAYRDYLRWVQHDQLQLPDESVEWTGSVSEAQLEQAYAGASAYICMSEDEGFCVPIFEAMARGVPVFAYGHPAVRETAGGAGVLFNEKTFDHLARQLDLLLTSPVLLDKVVQAQLARARALSAEMDGSGFLQMLSDKT